VGNQGRRSSSSSRSQSSCLSLPLHHVTLCSLLLQMVSTMANTSVQEVASASQHLCLLFQLYVIRDRALVTQWVRQAEAAGYKALVITVDAQRLVSQRARWHSTGRGGQLACSTQKATC
jgi:hypothetical protein